MAWPQSQAQVQELQVQSSLVNGTGTITDFPVLLTRDNVPDSMVDPSGGSAAQTDGGDIRFATDADGNSLVPCEVVKFGHDSVTGAGNAEIEIWVKLDISGTSDTSFYMAWDTSGTTSQPAVGDAIGRNAVWSNYFAVWHLSEDGTGGAASIIDSSGNGADLDANNFAAASNADAPWGTADGALDFDGSNDFLDGTPVDLNTNSVLTVVNWLRLDVDNASQRPWNWFRALADGFGLLYSSNDNSIRIYDDVNNADTSRYVTAVSVQEWHHYAVSIDASDNLVFHIDGSGQTGETANASLDELGTDNFFVGERGNGNNPTNGQMDEIRLFNGAMSADETITVYNNQNNPAGFTLIAAAGEDLVRVIDEVVGISEDTVRALGLNRVIDETVGINETLATSRTLARVTSEVEGIVEDVVKSLALTRITDETETIVETTVAARVLARVVDETVGITESALRVLGLVQVIDETEGITEVSDTALGIVKVIEETVTLTETLATAKTIVKEIADSVSVLENLVTARTLARVVDEVETVSEVLVRARDLIRVEDETEGVAEEIVRSRTLVRVLDEVEGVQEALVRVRALLRVISETEGVSEEVVRALTTAVGALLTATVNLKARLSGDQSLSARITGTADFHRDVNDG